MATIYVDFTSNSGFITGTWTFTNASASVTGVGGAATTELANGNYIRQSDGTQWYKVTARPDDNTITITPAFQQATHTDDLNATLKNAKGGTGIADAYCHINQATTDTTRSPGDIIKVRANQTHVLAAQNIEFDEDGTAASWITLKGCTSTDDPWGDASDVKPILAFGNTIARVNKTGDFFWLIQNLELINSTSASGALYSNEESIIENCVAHNNTDGFLGIGTKFINCVAYSNTNRGFICQWTNTMIDCQSYSNAVGLAPLGYMDIEMYNCQFGAGGQNTTADIDMTYAPFGRVFGRNVQLASTVEVRNYDASGYNRYKCAVFIEDDEGTKLANRAWLNLGNLQRGITDVGGCTHWLRAIPNAGCTPMRNLPIFVDLPIWLPASQKTITVKLLGNSWQETAGVPNITKNAIWIELAHWDSAATKRAIITSTKDATPAFASNDTWTDFSVTVTPNSEGPAYLSCYLGRYEDGTESIYVDIAQLPIIT